MYTIAVLGNFSILFTVKMETSLHVPMFYFLCMLAVIDLGLSTSILPKKLSIFWFSSREIDFSACLIQMYFIHCFLEMESGIFVAMAVDHYVAICHPLRHSTILTNPVVAKISLAVVLRRSIFVLPYPLLILRAIFSLSTKDIQLKTFGTCSSHLCAILAFYIPALLSSLMYQFGHTVSLHFHILIAEVYLQC
ncbi:olfactory receptor 52M1-like [Natator depressus]|uniref:olfactory receptor 52M1-like n=1 Tax=Natator depressus TaxID=27790 RepID=UPI003EB98A32